MTASPTGERVPRLPAAAKASALLSVAGLAAAFGAASCCALPFLLASLGLGAAWLGGIALLAFPHRTLLLALAAGGLAGGAALLWWPRRRAACVPGAACAGPLFRTVVSAGLLAGLLLLYLGYAYA